MLPLNAAIALSIFFLGPEIVRSWRGETSFTIEHPWVVAFVFGLLHGFGFASALTSAGLPRADLPLALLGFNVGVEIGQLALHPARPPARALVPGARDPLAALGRGPPGLRGRDAGRVLAHPADRDPVRMDLVRNGEPGGAPGRCRSSCWPAAALAHLAGRRGHRLPRRSRASGLRPRSRPRDDRRRPLGRAARAAGGVASARDLPDRHGVRRNARPRRRRESPASRSASRSRRSASAPRSSSRRGRSSRSRPRSSASSRSSTATPTAPSCPRAATRSSTASASSSRPGLLHATGIAIGLIHRWPAGRTALRCAGAAVALAGLAFLWRALT